MPTMTNPAVHGYHAHVYYSAGTRLAAERLAHRLNENFDVEIGAFSGERVGPHPIPQFQMIFKNEQFAAVVPWLMLNRDGLDVLVHPLTDSSYNNHTALAMWLGAPVALKTDTLRHAPVGDSLMPSSQRQHA